MPSGGKRPNQTGRPKKEETTTISIRLPTELKLNLLEKYKGKINKKVVDYLRTLV